MYRYISVTVFVGVRIYSVCILVNALACGQPVRILAFVIFTALINSPKKGHCHSWSSWSVPASGEIVCPLPRRSASITPHSLPRSLSEGGDPYHNVTDVGATHSSVLGIHCKNNVKWTLTLTVNYFQSPFLRLYTHFSIKLAVRFRKSFLHVSQCSSVLQCVRPTSWVCVHNTCEWV